MTNTTRNIDPFEEEYANIFGDEYSKRIEDEIDAIRIALYEETKDMTSQQFNAHIGKEIDPIFEQYGIKSVSTIVEWKPSKIIKERC
jgi:hypothetical protein